MHHYKKNGEKNILFITNSNLDQKLKDIEHILPFILLIILMEGGGIKNEFVFIFIIAKAIVLFSVSLFLYLLHLT